jgi:hypothetical protein
MGVVGKEQLLLLIYWLPPLLGKVNMFKRFLHLAQKGGLCL